MQGTGGADAGIARAKRAKANPVVIATNSRPLSDSAVTSRLA